MAANESTHVIVSIKSFCHSLYTNKHGAGKKPCIAHMRVFRCIAYVMMPNGHRDKLDAKGTKCLFLGYGKSTKAYRLVC